MLYDNVKAAADKKKMTLSAVEREAQLAKGTISKWKTVSPNLKSLTAVANVLNVSVSRLIR